MSRHLVARLLVIVAACAVCVSAFDPLPSFPAVPMSLLELSESDAMPSSAESVAPIMTLSKLREPKSAMLVELGDAELDMSLPSAEVAYTAAVPGSAMHADPLTAALALDVPNPNTFLKDDVFLQQLVQQRESRDAEQFAEHAAELQAENFFETSAVSVPSFNQGPPPRRGSKRRGGGGRQSHSSGRQSSGRSGHSGRQSRSSSHGRQAHHGHNAQKAEQESDAVPGNDSPPTPFGTAPTPPAHGKFSGPHQVAIGGIFPAHRRGTQNRPSPRHQTAPHQQDINRRYRNAAGQFEANKSYRDTVQRAFAKGFPHHRGHTKLPHNKGRPESSANQPKKNNKRRHSNAFPSRKSLRSKKLAGFMEMSSQSMQAPAPGPQGGRGRRMDQAPGAKDGFENIIERRADLRAIAQRAKDEEFATMQAEADVARLKGIAKIRQQVLDDHVDSAFKSRSNLNTMFAAANGVFDRMPAHPTQLRRGSLVRNLATPARRVVPSRLARLEDQRRSAARRTYARGRMQETYHAQLHGTELGVGISPAGMEFAAPDTFLQVKENARQSNQRAPTMALPPQ